MCGASGSSVLFQFLFLAAIERAEWISNRTGVERKSHTHLRLRQQRLDLKQLGLQLSILRTQRRDPVVEFPLLVQPLGLSAFNLRDTFIQA
jgi:hypothetical protein